ncbi:MAG: transcriptional repressor [Candidatus Zixiibacteriota bacterium]
MTARRNTLQRKIILEEVRGSLEHPTAAEVHAEVRKRIPHISLGTVYRNLDLLSQEGLIRKLEPNGREARFDGILTPHYHLRCRVCGRIEDVLDPVTVRVDGGIDEPSGWQVLIPQVEFAGLCPDCGTGSQVSPRDNATRE